MDKWREITDLKERVNKLENIIQILRSDADLLSRTVAKLIDELDLCCKI